MLLISNEMKSQHPVQKTMYIWILQAVLFYIRNVFYYSLACNKIILNQFSALLCRMDSPFQAVTSSVYIDMFHAMDNFNPQYLSVPSVYILLALMESEHQTLSVSMPRSVHCQR